MLNLEEHWSINMNKQLELFNLPTINKPDYPQGATHQEKFDLFHAENPHVYDEIVRRAWALKAAGFNRYNVQAIFTQMRQDYNRGTTGRPYKFSNSLSPYYVREIHAREPGLRTFFVKGKLKGEEEGLPGTYNTFSSLETGSKFYLPGGQVIYEKLDLDFYEDPETLDMVAYNAVDEQGRVYYLPGDQTINQV